MKSICHGLSDPWARPQRLGRKIVVNVERGSRIELYLEDDASSSIDECYWLLKNLFDKYNLTTAIHGNVVKTLNQNMAKQERIRRIKAVRRLLRRSFLDLVDESVVLGKEDDAIHDLAERLNTAMHEMSFALAHLKDGGYTKDDYRQTRAMLKMDDLLNEVLPFRS